MLRIFILSAHLASLPPLGTDALISDLASPQFQTREAASRKLQAIGEPARIALAIAAKSKDLEQARRAGRILCQLEIARVMRAVCEINREIGVDPGCFPCVDFVWIGRDYNTPAAWLGRAYFDAAGDWPQDGRGWGRYRVASRNLAIDARLAGVPMWVIRGAIGELERREAEYLRRK